MEYGIPIPAELNFIINHINTDSTTSNDYELYLKNIYDTLVLELPDDAVKNIEISSKYGQYVDEQINCPNLLNANKLTISSEALVGLTFGDYEKYGGTQKFSTKASANWNAMSLGNEPDFFFVLRTQQAYTNAYLDDAYYSYSNDRIIILAKYRYNGGGYRHQFMLDIKHADNNFGMEVDLYYVCGDYKSNPNCWIKLPYIDAHSNYLDFFALANNSLIDISKTFEYKKFDVNYISDNNYQENININMIENINLNFISNELYSKIGKIDKTEYYESYQNKNLYDNHNYINQDLNLSTGIVKTINMSDWKKYNDDWISELNKESNLKPIADFKGFIEGRYNSYNNEVKFVYNRFNTIFKTISVIDYNFSQPVDTYDISIIVDGVRRYIDINKPMIRGYISGKVNTSGCSGQSFVVKCYRHSNNDFIGEYNVDIGGNYFIPNLNYLDEYDIMLVDYNSVIETKVSSKRKPILNDEINELKLECHSSTLNTDLLLLFEFTVLKFSYNKDGTPYVSDDSSYTPKLYTMYNNITPSYPSYINWWEYGQKYYMNSNAHIVDVRYIDNNNIINTILNRNSEFEITLTFNHFGHSYNQWNALFACSDTSNKGNLLCMYNDQIFFGAYDQSTGLTHQTQPISISRNKVYTAIIKRKNNIVTLTVADAVTLSSPLSQSIELPSGFTWDFSKIKLGCAWGGSQFWGDFVDFEFKIL